MIPIRTLIILLLLFSLVVIGFSGFVGELATNYDANYTDLSYLNKTSQVQERVSVIQEALDTSDVSAIERIQSFFSGGYSVLMLIPQSLDIFTTVVKETGQVLGLPPFVIPIVLTVITVIIVFGIISALLKYEV